MASQSGKEWDLNKILDLSPVESSLVFGNAIISVFLEEVIYKDYKQKENLYEIIIKKKKQPVSLGSQLKTSWRKLNPGSSLEICCSQEIIQSLVQIVGK